MSSPNQDWKIEAFETLVATIPFDSEDEEILESLMGNEEWEQEAFQQYFKKLNPLVDLAAFENGVSASQLGALTGHTMESLKQLDSIAAIIHEMCGQIQLNWNKALELASKEEKSELQDQIELANSLAESLQELPAFVEKMKSRGPIVTKAINECMREAARQGGSEAKAFFTAFGKALDIQTLDSKGNLITENAKTANVYSLLLLMGDSVKQIADSVPDLHQLLVLMTHEGVLSRDKDSIEWSKDRKLIEGVCRQLGLRFRERGRPSKKENPNHK